MAYYESLMSQLRTYIYYNQVEYFRMYLYKHLESGSIDINELDNNGDSLLVLAIEDERFEMVKILVDAGIDLNIGNMDIARFINTGIYNYFKFVSRIRL